MRSRYVIAGTILTALFIVVFGFRVMPRYDELRSKASKFDAYCLQVRGGVSTDIHLFQEGQRARAVERFTYRIDDLERCADVSPARFQRCDERCVEGLMLEARQRIAVPE